MSDIQPDSLREALQFLIRSDMPAEPKQILITVVMESLATREAAAVVRSAIQQPHAEWQQTETDAATAFLHDKVAKSWQNADENVMHLAWQLHRPPVDIRSKAIELGFAVAVDYQQARIRSPA